MYRRRFASAFGAGSVATTLRPRARYKAAQLAPITPVPTIATFRISWLFAISPSKKFASIPLPVCSETFSLLGLRLPRFCLVHQESPRWYADHRFRHLENRALS